MAPRNTDPLCERLGDLAASLTPSDDGHLDGAQWAGISERLDQRHGKWLRRPFVPVVSILALSAVVLVTGGYLLARRPLGYRVETCGQTDDGAACTTGPGMVAFTDGTRIELESATRIHVKPLSFAHGAELSLDGDARLSVVHRTGARWTVLAGPFRVEVTGTRFAVHWSRQIFDVTVTQGEVRVSGGTLAEPTLLHSGQSLHADLAPKAAQPEVPGALAPEATPAERSARPSKARHAGLVRAPRRRNAKIAVLKPAKTKPSESPTEAQPGSRHFGDSSLGDTSLSGADSLGPSEQTPPVSNRVTFAADGRLDGGMTGQAWLARGNGTKLSFPASTGGFINLQPGPEGFCASGTVAGVRCVNENIPQARCDWHQNWGAAIGFDVKADRRAWGTEAAHGLAIEFRGRSANYRLNAHRKSDPAEKTYCIDGYRSGQMVTPGMLRTRCWDVDGEPLSDFKDVDLFNLQFQSGMDYVAFHYCVSGIRIER